MILKCKMCGGTLEYKLGDTVATCDSCGTLQTLPKMDDERRTNLYDRANHYRRANDFDKAMGIYEQILNEDKTDAESYWSIVLCRYGIEYVEDPRSHKRVPTVNRAQYTSIYDDADYKSALEYATTEQKEVYEEEAETINEIQKEILAISQKEEPFDVFICYKETDTNGRRTQDSVLANDLYHQLTQEGFKVFFSRITLEDKLGTAYEPYIFAALNSAKVMVVLGTKEEYFNAVWVKNEWSRFLSLIRDGKKKILIPAYRDMDPYDLPEEFSHLQAQDMSKLGFMQDLIRGIKKMIVPEKKVEMVNVSGGESTSKNEIQPLLTRVSMFLEDGEWEKADQYAERILDMNPKCAEAYLDKMMVELQVHRVGELSELEDSFEKNRNYLKFIQYADEESAKKVGQLLLDLKSRPIYEEALDILNNASKMKDCDYAKAEFEKIIGYKDAKEQITRCQTKKEEIRDIKYTSLVKKYETALTTFDFQEIKDEFREIEDYKDASSYMEECEMNIKYLRAVDLAETCEISNMEEAIRRFEKLDGFKDSNQKIKEVNENIALINRRNNIKKRIKIIVFIVIGVIILAWAVDLFMYYDSDDYKSIKAKEYVKNNQYEQAIESYQNMSDEKRANQEITKIGDEFLKKNLFDDALRIYKIAKDEKKIKDTRYKQADALLCNHKYDEAIEIFQIIKDEKKIKETRLKQADFLLSEREYNKASAIYRELGEKEKQKNVVRKQASDYLHDGYYEAAIKVYKKLNDKKNVKYAKDRLGQYYISNGEYDKAYKLYKKIKSKKGMRRALLTKATVLYEDKKYSAALKVCKKIGNNYAPAKELKEEIKNALYEKEKEEEDEALEQQSYGYNSEYILPNSNSTYLTESDLSYLSDTQIDLAKNELYARHGRKFNRQDLQEYFDSKSWYSPVYSPAEWEEKGDAYFFNDYEIANRNLLRDYK